MAKEYIEREAAKEELVSWARCINDPKYLFTEDAMCVLDGMKAADVVEVRHGRWERVQNPQWKAHSHDKCNLCGWWNTRNALCYDGNHKPGHSLNYCPNCGARMDGEK